MTTDNKRATDEAVLDALKRAAQFIVNGTEFGYIRMPDAPDPALEALPAIQKAIAALSARADQPEPVAVHSVSDVRDALILANVRRIVKRSRMTNLELCMETFGFGSTSAYAMCKRLGLEDQMPTTNYSAMLQHLAAIAKGDSK